MEHCVNTASSCEFVSLARHPPPHHCPLHLQVKKVHITNMADEVVDIRVTTNSPPTPPLGLVAWVAQALVLRRH